MSVLLKGHSNKTALAFDVSKDGIQHGMVEMSSCLDTFTVAVQNSTHRPAWTLSAVRHAFIKLGPQVKLVNLLCAFTGGSLSC